jgi:hypothetical protein
MAKTFKIREDGIRFELRGDALNLLNRTTFGPLSGGNDAAERELRSVAQPVEFAAPQFGSPGDPGGRLGGWRNTNNGWNS